MIRLLLAVAIVAITIQSELGVAADAVKAAKGPKFGYKGKFASFNPDLNTVIVAKGSKTVTFALDKNAKLIVDQGKTSTKLADLPVDTNVGLVLNADKTIILEMHADGPGIRCTVESIDADARTLCVKTSKAEVVTYSFLENVAVTRGRNERKLDDLKVGATVSLKLAHDKSKVVGINLVADKKK